MPLNSSEFKTTNGHHTGHASDEAIDTLYAWFPPQKAPQPVEVTEGYDKEAAPLPKAA